MKQRHTAWVCVGTNDEQLTPTWFYAFRKWEDGNKFMDAASDTVSWDMYPCELMTVEDTLYAMRAAMDETSID